jgi:hypothetical protein
MSRDDKISKRVLRSLYASQDPLGFSIENEINVIYWNHPGKDDEGEGVIFVDVREGLSIEWWMEGIERRSALAETYRLADMISR